MPKYSLTADISDKQLGFLTNSHQSVVVAKPTGEEGKEGNPIVAWQVFRPMENNSLQWEEEYGIYASSTTLTNGAVLDQFSKTGPGAAADGKLYKIEESGGFSTPGETREAGTYYAENLFSKALESLTVGLFQTATVNGKRIDGNAISAAPVPRRNAAEMTPYTTLYIWTQASIVSNTVLTEVTSPRLEVVFGGPTTDVTVHYDSDQGGFVVGPQNKGVTSHLLVPAYL